MAQTIAKKVTASNHLPAEGDARFPVYSKQFNELVDVILQLEGADGILTADSIVVAGSASGTNAVTLTAGDLTLTDGHIVVTEGNLTLTDGGIVLTDGDITVGTSTGTKIGTATSQKIGFYNATPVVQPTALTTASTTLTNAGTASDYAIQALTNSSPFGFVSQAEGETVVDVVLNNQARLNEIETKLQALGLLA